MLRPFFYFLLLIFAVFCSLNTQAQEKFPENPSEFINKLDAMLRRTQMPQVIKTAEEFTALWGSKYTPEQKNAMIALCNTMVEKKCRPSPHFEKVLDLYILVYGRKDLDKETFLQLIQTTDKVFQNHDLQVSFQYISSVLLYFKYNMLFTNGFYKLKVSKPAKIVFEYRDAGAFNLQDTANLIPEQVATNAFNDWDALQESTTTPDIGPQPEQKPEVDAPQPPLKGPIMYLEDVSFKIESGFDSTVLRKTKGHFMLLSKVWVGEGGTFDWSSAGMKRNQVYVELKQYNFDVRYPELRADNVMLYYKDRLETTLLGAFEYKSKKKNSYEEAIYPRFKSYYAESRFKDVKEEGLYYLGGFSMEGRRVNSSSVYGGKSLLKIKNKKGDYAVKLISNRFDFLDTAISAGSAYCVLYYGQDSLVHPSARVVYSPIRREIKLYADKGRFKECFFSESRHNLEIQTDMVEWFIDKPNIEFNILMAKNKVPAIFESKEFFAANRFTATQGIYTFHPLMMVQAYANKIKQDEFYALDMAESFKQNIEGVRSAMLSIASQGYIEYDQKSGLIRIKDKLKHYTSASKGKKDYDFISIPSVNPGRVNGVLNTNKDYITVYGVDKFFLSDSLNVFVIPNERKVRITGNRDVVFDGKVNAGDFTIFGDSFRFDYQEFKIDMGNIDSMEIKTSSAKVEKDAKGKVKKTTQATTSKLYGFDKNKSRESGGYGKAVLYINKPDNKSSRKKMPQYPIFNVSSPSYIYFDRVEYLKGKYNTKVFFRLPPFEVDSMSQGSAKSLSFEGTFNSDNIFPEFPEKLIVRPDKSLGFLHKTPEEGYPIYGTDARFFGTVSLDFKGIRGKGEIKYLSATIKSEDFIFYQDSIIARGRSFIVKPEIIAGVEFPDVNSDGYKMRWYPRKDSLFLASLNKQPFQLYAKSVQFEGELVLSKNGMYGGGYIQTQGARAEAELYTFGAEQFVARRGFFEVKSNNPLKPVLSSKNVRFSFNIKDKIAKLSPEKAGYPSNEFPFSQYKTSIPNVVWDINKKLVTMDAPDSIDIKDSYFYSTNKEQDSLVFNARSAIYDISKSVLTISGIPQINVADAAIVPDSNRVMILENAVMRTLKNAKVLVDTANKYHKLAKANIKIHSRLRFEGDGVYQFVNSLGDTIDIKFDNFEMREPDKKKPEAAGLYTVSGGTIPDSKPIVLAQGILFRGGVTMSALKPNLEFNGEIKLDLKKTKNTNWVAYQTTGDSKEFELDIRKAKDREGTELVTGVYLEDGTNKLYTSFLGPKRTDTDVPLFAASGFLTYSAATKEFRVSTPEKSEGKVYEGNTLVYNDSTAQIAFEGKLLFQTYSDKDFVITAAGAGKGQIDSSQFSINTFLAFNFNLPPSAWKAMGTILAKRATDLSLSEAIEDKNQFIVNLACAAGNKAGQDYEKATATRNANLFSVVPRFGRSLVLSEVKLNWHPKYKAWYSTGKIGLLNVLTNQVNAQVEGFIEIKYTDGGDLVNIYLEGSPDSWFYFGYDETRRLSVRSANEEFNNAIEAKAKEGREGTYYFTLAENYEKNKFLKMFKRNYLGIDVGDVVEEIPETREKSSDDSSNEDLEQKPKPKEKEKKRKRRTDEEGIDPDAEDDGEQPEAKPKKPMTDEEAEEAEIAAKEKKKKEKAGKKKTGEDTPKKEEETKKENTPAEDESDGF
jgi:hypothetical protein